MEVSRAFSSGAERCIKVQIPVWRSALLVHRARVHLYQGLSASSQVHSSRRSCFAPKSFQTMMQLVCRCGT
jgi:hypothetical protein